MLAGSVPSAGRPIRACCCFKRFPALSLNPKPYPALLLAPALHRSRASSPARSSLLMKARRGTLYRRICRSTVIDWLCTPPTAHNTSTAPSSTRSARSTCAVCDAPHARQRHVLSGPDLTAPPAAVHHELDQAGFRRRRRAACRRGRSLASMVKSTWPGVSMMLMSVSFHLQ